MRRLIRIFSLSLAVLQSVAVSTEAQLNVTQHHNHDSRDGLYVDPAFTQNPAGRLAHDLGFDGTISGNVYTQPIYVERGPNGPMVIVATESNNVYALDATTGTVIWQRNNLGTPGRSAQVATRSCTVMMAIPVPWFLLVAAQTRQWEEHTPITQPALQHVDASM
jgi:outer membrane protein assembly factor BamB